MPIPAGLDFAPGVTVNILMENGSTFTGELVDAVDGFLLVRLTTATGPFMAGEVVRLNINRILAIG